MRRTLTLTISNCDECPYLEEYTHPFGGVEERWCKKLELEIASKTFSEECPLEIRRPK